MNAADFAGRGAYAGEDFARRESEVRTAFWGKVRKVAVRVPFLEELIAVYYCAMDRATPLRVRGMLLAALAYFILPADAVPDLIAGLGFTDDAAVFWAAFSAVKTHIQDRHRDAAARALDRPVPDRVS